MNAAADAFRREVGLGVVAEEFGIAEEVAGFERNASRTRRPGARRNWRARRLRARGGGESAAGERKPSTRADHSQRQRNGDGGFLGEHSGSEP